MTYLKYIIPAVLILLTIVGYQVYKRGIYTFLGNSNLERVDALEAEKLLSEKAYTILDVREGNEFEVSHINGALRYEESLLQNLDPNKPLLIYCTAGIRSNKLAKSLTDMGFKKVIEMQDGLIGWSNAQLPMVNSSNKITDSIHVYNQYFATFLKKGTPVY